MDPLGNPSGDKPSLEDLLLRHPQSLWRGQGAVAPGGIPAGIAALEKILPGGAWPGGALIEVVGGVSGTGGLRLFLPVMRHVALREKYIAWVDPPHSPYGPSLAAEGLDTKMHFVVHAGTERQGLWAFERLLRSPECGLALSWPGVWSAAISRRLRLAAGQGGGLGVAFLRAQPQLPFSFASLRLALQPGEGGLAVRVLKAPAGQGREAVLTEV